MNEADRPLPQQPGFLSRLDAWADRIESASVGRAGSDALLLLGRVLVGLPLLMNGIGQVAMPALIEAQMIIVGVSLAWKWPAILASMLGGLALAIGWRVRLAAALLIIYVVAATLLFHNTHTLVTGDDPLAVPDLALRMCEWYFYEFKGVAAPVSEELLRGCGSYRLFFDGAKTMDHFTMLVPCLLLLIATGGGAYSLENVLRRRRRD